MGPDSEPAAGPPPGRSEQKRKAILDAAIELFLTHGYSGTSMDMVAASASVSKQTVYKHFSDKETLFVDLVTSTVRGASDPVEDVVLRAPRRGDLRRDLADLAHRLLDHVLRARVMQVRRLVIGEANRFPQLAASFYELGPARTMRALAGLLRQLADDGQLRVVDADLAAEQLNWLVLGGPVNRAMLLGEAPSLSELGEHIDAAVTTFLAAYAPRAGE